MTAEAAATPVERWTRALDDLEAQLLAHLDYLASDDADGRDAPVSFAPPQGMPPIPDVLQPRAQRLVQAIRTVTSELEVEHQRIAGELQKLRRLPRPARRDSEAFDTRA